MKIKTKEELKNALLELRKGKDKQENYNYTPPCMAMCYSTARPRYRRGRFIGRHKCLCCGENFGTNCNDEIALCQEKRYQDYLEYQYIFFGSYPCFTDFLSNFNDKNPKILNYLKEQNLEFNNENKYSNDPIYAYEEARGLKHRNTPEKSFNRLLTKEEWIKLNTNCEKNHCFYLNPDYDTYQRIYDKYKAAGYDVKLEYNCPKCCENGKNEIEFWFRFNDNEEYIISQPSIENSNFINYTTYTEYMIVLEFLNGCHSYEELLTKSFDRDEDVEKSKIDNALNKIVGTNIKYDKNEINRYIKQNYKILTYNEKEESLKWPRERKTEDQINNENIETNCIFNIFKNILSLYDDSYEFSLSEYSILMKNVAEFKDYDMEKLSLATRAEIVEKRTIFYLKNIDNILSNEAIYEYLENKFPKGKPITPNSRNYEIKYSKADNENRYVVFKFLDLIFDIYGNDFKISIALFERLIKLFNDKLSRYETEDIEEIKDTFLEKIYVKNFVEGK